MPELMEWGDAVRVAIEMLCLIVLLQKVLFLRRLHVAMKQGTSEYRGSATDHFCYHIGVTMVVIAVLVGQFFALSLNRPLTPATFLLIPGLLLLAYALTRLSIKLR